MAQPPAGEKELTLEGFLSETLPNGSSCLSTDVDSLAGRVVATQSCYGLAEKLLAVAEGQDQQRSLIDPSWDCKQRRRQGCREPVELLVEDRVGTVDCTGSWEK